MKNCLTYALGKYLREGGYLLVRQSLAARMFGVSHWSPIRLVPHFLHMTEDGVVTQYVPTEEQIERHSRNLVLFWLSLWHFDGRVVEGGCHVFNERFDCNIPVMQ